MLSVVLKLLVSWQKLNTPCCTWILVSWQRSYTDYCTWILVSWQKSNTACCTWILVSLQNSYTACCTWILLSWQKSHRPVVTVHTWGLTINLSKNTSLNYKGKTSLMHIYIDSGVLHFNLIQIRNTSFYFRGHKIQGWRNNYDTR